MQSHNKTLSACIAGVMTSSAVMAGASAQSPQTPAADQPVPVQTQPIYPDAEDAPSGSSPGPADTAITNQTPNPPAAETAATVAVPDQLLNKTVISLNGNSVGKVSEVHTDDSGKLSGITAEFGGFLGIGAKALKVTADDFIVDANMIILDMDDNQVDQLLQ